MAGDPRAPDRAGVRADASVEKPITRRAFIRVAGAAGLAAGLGSVLAACGGGGGGTTGAATQPSTAAGGAVSAPSGATGRTLTIGYVSPQTGPLAAFGATDKWVVGQLAKQFSEGIDVGGTTHPVQVTIKDTQSDPDRAAQVTQDLIDGGVDLVIPGATPETTNPVGDTCEANGVPCLSTVAPWQPWFFRNPSITPTHEYKWNWHFFWGLEDIIAVFLDMWSQVETNKVVGGLYPNDGDGNAWGDPKTGFPPALKQAGYTLVDPGRFEDGNDDFSAQIAQFKSRNCQIVTGVPIPPDFTTFWTQAAQQDFKPRIATVGKALLFPSSVDALGKLGEGLSSEVWWAPTHPFKSSLTGQTSSQLAEAWISGTGKQWTQPLGYVHAVLEVAVDVFKRTQDVDDPQSIVDAIKSTNLDTIAGHVSWASDQVARIGDQPIPNVAKMKLAGGQWRKGTKFPYDLVVVSNKIFPEVPVQGKLEPLPGSV